MSTKLSFKKVTVEIIKLEEKESFIGRLTQVSNRDWTDRNNGHEVKEIKQFHFDVMDENGEIVKKGVYFGDAGFRNTISLMGILTNDVIQVTKLNKKDLGNDVFVNEYEILKAE